MNNKLKIAYFAGTMKPGQDGVTRVLYCLIDTLEQENVESIFFSPIIPPKGSQKVNMVKVPSLTVPFNKDYRFAIPGSRYFESELRIFDPDLIHINSPCPLGHAAVIYANKNNIPVVATYHTHFPGFAKYYKMKMFELFSWSYLISLYNKCDTVFVPSIPILNELSEHGLQTGELLPHGVDTKLFSPAYKDENWKLRIGAAGSIVILYAGRLVKEKDLNVLSACYRVVSAKRKNIKFVLVGDGPIRNELEELMPNAIFLGYQSGKDLSTAYASSDIFVFPSSTETFGNVVLEAMSSMLPPICVKEGGAFAEIKDEVTGLIAEPRNINAFIEKLLFLIDNPEQRMKIAKRAYEYSQEQNWLKIFRKLFNRYKEIHKYHSSSIRAA
jgi:phosphatidylinositol alpha 1,6-mannosyltransferase